MSMLASHGRKGWLAFAGVPASLVVWEALSHLHLVDPLLLPSPERVLAAVGDIGPELVLHIAATTARVLGGFVIAVLVGFALGVAMQRNRRVYAILDGLIETARPVPPVALVPFFILLFGFSEIGRLVLVVLGGSLVITVSVVEALHATPPPLLRYGLLLRLAPDRLYRLILIPAAIPKMAAGFRIAWSLILSLVIVSEFLGARYGLGYLVSVAKVTLTTPTMLLCVALLGVIGLAGDSALRWIFGRLTLWQSSAKDVER